MKLNKGILLTVVLGMLMFLGWSNGYAQLKIRYVNSQRILNEYPQAKEIQKKLDEIRAGYEKEYNQMLQQYNQLVK